MDEFGTNPTNSLSDEQLNWKLGVNYHITDDMMAYASAATGFKSGGFNGGFLSTDPETAARQRTPVDPEEVTAYEVGLKSSAMSGRIRFDISAFYNDYQNQQVFALVPPLPGRLAPVNVLDNAKQAHTQGLDIQLALDPVESLTLTANLGLLDTELDEFVAQRDPAQSDFSGNKLPLASDVTASLSAEWRHPIGDGLLTIQANSNYRSEYFSDVDNNPFTEIDARWLHNLRVGYEFGSDQWEIAAFARNLGDEEYYQQIFDLRDPFGFLQGIVGSPRTVGVELNYQY